MTAIVRLQSIWDGIDTQLVPPRATQHVGRVTSGLVLARRTSSPLLSNLNSRYRQDEMVDVNTRTFRRNMMS